MSSVLPHLTCVFLLALWGWSCSSMAFPFNMSMDGSGDEPELIFPTSRSTYVPPPLSASPSPPPSITTTFIRLKDFLFNRVVDFLRDNLLLITVVMSLLVVLIFIVCCASAMSHKRKLEAYYPPKKYVPRKYMAGQGPDRPQQQQQQQGQSQHKPQTTTNYHRTPSKALVGEKEGKDPRPKPQEVQKQVEEVQEVEVPKVVEKKKVDELKPSTSTAGNGQVMVCTCHLKKAH
uniref:Transmembrane protein 119 n=1 Tax=Astyanax mexicanus TaxID=7994 RepID=A0A3B1IV72_ASTMX